MSMDDLDRIEAKLDIVLGAMERLMQLMQRLERLVPQDQSDPLPTPYDNDLALGPLVLGKA